jgi:acetyltransferase-like isoleucine patch superfamily enzyme
MFVNDLVSDGNPARDQPHLWMPTTIGNHVTIGTHATVLPVTICDNVIIGAGSVVTHNIKQPGTYAGNPARLLREF